MALYYGYTPSFCNEKDSTNETYLNIKVTVEELTKDCKTEKEKARKIFEWAHNNIEYQYAYTASANIDRIYEIFNDKKGNCESYTMLTNYMLYLCDIPTATVHGLDHEWSAALVDGKWIYIDSTQGRFETTTNHSESISFAYDGLIYVLNEPTEGCKLAGIAKSGSEIAKLTTFTIPTNPWMKDIYPSTFSRYIELRAKVGTVGEEFIKNYREYWIIKGNEIIGSNTQRYKLGDINEDGMITSQDARMILEYTVGIIDTFTDVQKFNADINNDKAITSEDARMILEYTVGIIDF